MENLHFTDDLTIAAYLSTVFCEILKIEGTKNSIIYIAA